MKLTKRILAIGAGLLLALPLAACGGDSDTGGAPGEGGKVVIGIKFDQPGLGLKEGDNYTGFDVEVAKYVAKDLGYTDVEFKESPSAQSETLLQSDQVKMIFATYSITDDRKQKISFAGPYFIAGQDLLVKADSPITGPDAMSGKKMCSVKGSTSATKFKEKYPDVTEVKVEGITDYEGEELENGKTRQWVITPNDGEPVAIAVIFEEWRNGADSLLTFVMVTTPPNTLIARITDRMPAILPYGARR